MASEREKVHLIKIQRLDKQPLVCCIMLTRDRPAMTKRAVECFRAQTYERKRLYVFDTGGIPCTDSLPDGFPDFNIVYHRAHEQRSIGALRNVANWWGIRPSSAADPDADIIAHFDDDDYSHPQRLAEQVALLQSSGADCVGYRDMLFWDSRPGVFCGAWLYSNPLARGYALGTSLMYWRKTWERVPFDDVQKGEDDRFCRKVGADRVTSVSSIAMDLFQSIEPRVIASIHGSNTSSVIQPGHQQFKRVPQWDEYCRKAMELK